MRVPPHHWAQTALAALLTQVHKLGQPRRCAACCCCSWWSGGLQQQHEHAVCLQDEARLPLKQPGGMLLTDLRALLLQCRRSKVASAPAVRHACSSRPLSRLCAQAAVVDGRTLARIAHAVSSPMFPAREWSKTPWWGGHAGVDFDAVLAAADRVVQQATVSAAAQGLS